MKAIKKKFFAASINVYKAGHIYYSEPETYTCPGKP